MKDKSRNNSRVVLVTTTFSQSVHDMRAKLAIRTAQAAKEEGFKIMTVDDSPCQAFRTALQEAGVTVMPQVGKGMGASRRQAIIAGINSGAEVVVWLEPEKHTIVSLLEDCIEPIFSGERSVIVPRRKNLNGYPAYQQWSEYCANWEMANITKRPDLDLFIGPRVMNLDAAKLMAEYAGERGDNWEILFVPIIRYLVHGFSIGSVTVDYVHPIEQLVEDDEVMRGKRDKQRLDLVRAMQEEAASLNF